MPRQSKEGAKVGANVSGPLREFIEQEARERGVDLSVVVIDALNFYKDYKPSPENVQVIVERILATKPELLDAPITRAIEKDPAILGKIASLIGAMALNKPTSRRPPQ